MFKSKSIISVLLVLSIFISSCSTVFNGSKDEVRVFSNPSNATISVNGLPYGPTPGILLLKRGDYHIIEIKKDGYKPVTIRTSRDITGWFWGNILCLSLLGVLIDFVSGNAYDVEPSYINVQLQEDMANNQIIELDNIDGINLYDEDNNLVGKINIAWE